MEKDCKVMLYENAKRRLYYLDVMKTIAIIFVIVYHVGLFSQAKILGENIEIFEYFKYYLRGLLSVCVPIFFFINGMLLLNKPFDLKKHIIKLFYTICIAIIFAVINYALISFCNDGTIRLWDALKSITFLRMSYNNHLWFLYALVVIYCFFPMIKLCWDKDKKIFYYFFVIIFILTFGNKILNQLYNIFAIVLEKDTIKDYNLFGQFNAVRGIYGYSIIYFMLGGIIYQKKEKIKEIKNIYFIALIILLISSLILCFYSCLISNKINKTIDIVWESYDTVFTLINVVCIFILSTLYKENKYINYIIEIIGSNTLGIYLLHMIVKNYLMKIPMVFQNLIIEKILFSFLMLIISLLLWLAIKRIPFFSKIING